MPSTYTLISSNVLSSTAASVTFSAIPSTYTDLVLRWSARTDYNSGYGDTDAQVNLRFNADSTTKYSYVYVRGNGASASSSYNLNNTSLFLSNAATSVSATSNSFNSAEIYIPNYLSTGSKPLSSITAQETNATTAYLVGLAGLYRGTSAISELSLTPQSSSNFVSGSSFYLYGIKNS
jgi:hypothetical protein